MSAYVPAIRITPDNVYFDGVPSPWLIVEDGVEVLSGGDNDITTVSITYFASSVEIEDPKMLEYYDPLTSPFLIGFRRDCDCDPAAFHSTDCVMTPIWSQTLRDTDTDPAAIAWLRVRRRAVR